MQVIEQLERSRPEIVHVFDQLVRTMPDGVYLTALKQTDRRLQLQGLAQSSTRVVAYMRNIDASEWLTRSRRSTSSRPRAPVDGSSDFTLYACRKIRRCTPSADEQVADGRTGRSAPMSVLDQIRDLDPNDPGRWPLPFRLGAIGLIFIVAVVLLGVLPGVEAEEAGARRARAAKRAQLLQKLEAKPAEGREPRRLQGAARGDGAVASARCCASCRTRPKCRTC